VSQSARETGTQLALPAYDRIFNAWLAAAATAATVTVDCQLERCFGAVGGAGKVLGGQ
jgi:hypothetical protein